jgi:hypothetical protein
MRRAICPVIAITIAIATVAATSGCGSGGDGELSLDELATSAGVMCQEGERKADAFADEWDFGAPRDASAADLYLEQQRQVLLDADARLLEATVKRLGTLTPDEEARVDLREFLGAQRNYNDQAQDLADFQGRVAAERDYDARELRKRFGDSYVADLDRARDAAVRASRKTLGGKAAKRCPPRPPSEAVYTFPTVEQAYLSRLRGDYEGTVRQFGPGKVHSSFLTKLHLSKLVRGRVGGFVDYPSFPCSGKWVFGGLKGRRFHYKETITSGRDNCSSGRASVRVVGDHLDFRWRSDGGTIDVVGTLTRDRAPA